MQQRHHNPARSLPNVFAFRIGEPLSDKVFADPFADVFALAFAGSGHAATLSTLSSGARAAALLLRTFAVGLRALGLYTPAQLLHNSPLGRSLSSLRALAKSLPVSGLLLQTFWSAASARLESSRRFEAARSAPDWRPIPSLRSVIPQAASRARFALDQAPHQSRLGTLLPLSLVGTRSCLCRDRLSQRWGASFSLRRLRAAYHDSPALGGLRKLSLVGSEEFLPFSLVARTTCAHRFIEPRNELAKKSVGLRALAPSNLRNRGNADPSQFKHLSIDDQTQNKELIKSYAAY
jgi:hypothetical protein